MDWREPAAGLGGGLIVTFVTWLLGRSDGAQTRREAEARRVTKEVITEEEIDVRLVKLETVLPRIEANVNETVALVRSTNETLNHLARDGRLPIRRTDPEY